MKSTDRELSSLKEKLILKLYVSGMTSKSMQAIENINRICTDLLELDYNIEIIDIYKKPELAAENHIIFCPSLIKLSPFPKKVVIGTLSDSDLVIKMLGLPGKRKE